MREPKTLFFDVETKPVKFWAWRTGKQYLRHQQIVENEKFDIICICWKWLGKREVFARDWGIRKQNSAKMINEFVDVAESADIVIGQNSDSFDIKQINTQRMMHNQPPIAWPTSEDTMKMVKKHFYVASSSQDYMNKLFGGTGKHRMEFEDWVDIVYHKDPKALAKMIRYCKKDILDLQHNWKRIRPYCEVKANRALISSNSSVGIVGCPSCGEEKICKAGTRVTRAGKYQSYRCVECAHYWRSNYKWRP